ncbi:hypothetical protein NLU13_3126 [Sarocladium strictum]|uniref:Uncharacterized protein n=1 Tax=Sarocladium strictum TaxID=5046 RepID=A0AA39L9F7_SARSR|nr:hypothetical protein NLU13_3126 [Sarocladium strictum]
MGFPWRMFRIIQKGWKTIERTLDKIQRSFDTFQNRVEARINDIKENLRISNRNTSKDLRQIDAKMLSIHKSLTILHENQRHEDGAAKILLNQRDEARQEVSFLKLSLEKTVEELEAIWYRFKGVQHTGKTSNAPHAEHVQKLEGIVQSIVEELQTAETERSANRPGLLSKGLKVCDEEIKTKWREMAHMIRSLAQTLSEAHGNVLEHSTMKVLGSAARRYFETMQDESTDRDVWSTCLWRLISYSVLLPHSDAWKGHPRQSLHQLKSNALDSLKEQGHKAEWVSRWLADGSHHFKDTTSEMANKRVFDLLLCQISASLMRTLPVQDSQMTIHIQQDVRAILAVACELQEIILSSRAFFSIAWHKFPTDNQQWRPFDPRSMEMIASTEKSQGQRVIWLLSPILSKRGNADGEQYDKEIMLVKADVICG